MSLQKHDLLHEFPEYRELIDELKTNHPRFTLLYDQYHALDQEIRRIETGVETRPDDYLEERKKERLQLKDQLFTLLKEHA